MLLDILLIVLGMALLVKGGDLLVDGASSLARRFSISELAIGLTIVAFGTSAPELVVSLSAALGSHSEIVLGNVIGSNNFNIFVILGITGLIAHVAVQKNTVRIEIPFSMLAALILLSLANFAFPSGEKNMLTRVDGLILLLFLGLFFLYVYKSMKKASISMASVAPGDGIKSEEKNPSIKTLSIARSTGFIVIGLVFLVLGGRFVVSSAVSLAQALNISEKVISLTIVAAGTSLPELVTSITAIVKKKDDIAMGNIIGSNILNIFMILGLCALISPIEYSPVFNGDIYLLIIGSFLLFLAMFTGKKRKLDRWESMVFVIIYAGYVVHIILR